MGIRRERLRRKTASGSYDTIHLETSADIVLLSDGSGLLEDELVKVKPIEKGGTGASTGSGAMYNLITGCNLLDQAADDDYLIVLDASEQTCKKILVSDLVNYVGGGSNPNWPDKSQLTLGNTINWAGQEWIVSHVTSTEVYLTLKHIDGYCTFSYLQYTTSTWSNEHFTDEQLQCLKRVVADTTNGKVFVATYDQMNGGFSYFNSNSRRSVGSNYWTSSRGSTYNVWVVFLDGSLYRDNSEQNSFGFRPSVCVDLTLYE